MKVLNSIFLGVLIIAAVNWGAIGLFDVNLIATLFGGMSDMLVRIIYILAGIAGLWAFSFFSKMDNHEDGERA